MIRVTFELLPGGNAERARTIGLMEICNLRVHADGTADYGVVLTKTPPFAGALRAAWRKGALRFGPEAGDAVVAGEDDETIIAQVSGHHRTRRHIRGDVREILDDGWDLLIVAHPPCTRLCNSGVRWLSKAPPGRTLPDMWAELDAGAALFSDCWNAPVPRVAVENPVMHRHARERIVNYAAPAQTVQPWQFGEPQFKAVSLWLRGLPKLVPTLRLAPPAPGTAEHRAWSRVHRMPPSPDRGRERSPLLPRHRGGHGGAMGRLGGGGDGGMNALETILAQRFAAGADALRESIRAPLQRIARASVKDAAGPAKADICAVLTARRRIAIYDDLAAWLGGEA